MHDARLVAIILIIIIVNIRVEARLSLVARILWLLLHFPVDEISRVPPPIGSLLPLELRREGDPFQSGRVLLVLSQECFLHGDVPSKPEVIAVVMLLLYDVAKEKCMQTGEPSEDPFAQRKQCILATFIQVRRATEWV